jgi:hypothetical protein
VKAVQAGHQDLTSLRLCIRMRNRGYKKAVDKMSANFIACADFVTQI